MSAKEKQVVEAQEKLDDITECPICTETYKEPKILPCIHTFCMMCLQDSGLKTNKYPGDKMPCPVCRTEFTIPQKGFDELQRNFFMDRLIEMKNILNPSSADALCDACKDDNDLDAEAEIPSADMYCADCNQRLCAECNKNHRKYKATKNHRLLSLDGAQINIPLNLNPSVCDQHENKPLEIYCSSCQEAVCALCLYQSHKTHDTSPVIEVVADFRRIIQENADGVMKWVFDLEQKKTNKNNDKELFAGKVADIETEVQRTRQNFHEYIDKDCDSLLKQLNSIKQVRVKEIESQIYDIEAALASLESYQAYCSQVTTVGSDADICRAAHNLNTRFTDLKQRYESVSFPLSPNFWLKKTEFCRALNQSSSNIIGGIEECEDLQSNTVQLHISKPQEAATEQARSNTEVETDQSEIYFDATTGELNGEELESDTLRADNLEEERNMLVARIVEYESNEQKLSKRIEDLEQQVDLLRRITCGEEKETKERGIIDWDVNTIEVSYTTMTIVRDSTNRIYQIYGVCILGNELFIAGNDGIVVVNDLKTLTFKRRWRIPFKEEISDIKHCNTNNCLYMLLKTPKAKPEIVRVDPNGEVISTWPVSSAEGQISVTSESNVLLTTSYSKTDFGVVNELSEYTPTGQLLQRIPLHWNYGIELASHALKLTSDHFVICHGKSWSLLVRVCLVDIKGTVLKYYGGERKQGLLDYPICMEIDSGGNLIVVDSSKRQVLLFNSNLEFKRCLFDHATKHPKYEKRSIRTSPTKICLDELNGRIFVVDELDPEVGKIRNEVTVYTFKA